MRFLLYTSDTDVRGIIATNFKWRKSGHGLGWIEEAYRLYGAVWDYLLLHHPDYPTVEQQSVLIPVYLAAHSVITGCAGLRW